jgi:putative membrane protein
MSRVGSFLIKVGVNAIAIWLATLVVPGIGVSAQQGETGAVENILTFVVIGLIFGLVNAVIKPVVKLLSLPFYILTLGLFAFLVNAFMLQITEWISEATLLTFYIDEFFWDAVLAAIVITFISLILNLILPDGD